MVPIQGEQVVNSYLVPAGGTVALWDADANVMWLKSKEPNGIVQSLRKFRMEEIKEQPQVQQLHRPPFRPIASLPRMAATALPRAHARKGAIAWRSILQMRSRV